MYINNVFFIGEEIDILWDGNPLAWQYLGSEEFNPSNIRYWTSNILSQFPMKGINLFMESSNTTSDLDLLRASLVYMIRIHDSTDNGFDIQEWILMDHDRPYLSLTNEKARLYSRLMLPGKYKLYDQAIYLFATSGKIICRNFVSTNSFFNIL